MFIFSKYGMFSKKYFALNNATLFDKFEFIFKRKNTALADMIIEMMS